MRSRLLWEDLHGGDRRLLWQPLRQRSQLPSPRGGKIPVSVIVTIPPHLIPIEVVIKCVNGGVVPRVGQVGASVGQVPLPRHRHRLSTTPLQRCPFILTHSFPNSFPLILLSVQTLM